MTDQNRLFLSPPDVGPRERERLLEAFDSGYVAPAGPMLEAFERAFADYVGLRHAVALASGTAALQIALRMLDLGHGDAVIAPTLTFIGGVAPIVHQGAQPIFVDSDPISWGLDPALLEDAFARAHAKGLNAKVVIPADLYGQCCDIDAIAAIAAGHNASVILDSAEAVGSLRKGQHAGQGALMAAYSFNGNKIITTSGGGMLCSDDAALIARARYLSTAARQPVAWYEHTEVGYNFRLSNLSAGLGLAQLEQIEAKVARRRAIFERYRAALGQLPGIGFAPEAAGCRHTRWLTVMLLDPEQAAMTPDEVRLALETVNIETRNLWKPMHLQPAFAGAEMVGGKVAEDLFRRGLCLPSGSSMSDADVDRVCEALTGLLKR